MEKKKIWRLMIAVGVIIIGIIGYAEYSMYRDAHYYERKEKEEQKKRTQDIEMLKNEFDNNVCVDYENFIMDIDMDDFEFGKCGIEGIQVECNSIQEWEASLGAEYRVNLIYYMDLDEDVLAEYIKTYLAKKGTSYDELREVYEPFAGLSDLQIAEEELLSNMFYYLNEEFKFEVNGVTAITYEEASSGFGNTYYINNELIRDESYNYILDKSTQASIVTSSSSGGGGFCERCNGTGRVVYRFYDETFGFETSCEVVVCPVCGGK